MKVEIKADYELPIPKDYEFDKINIQVAPDQIILHDTVIGENGSRTVTGISLKKDNGITNVIIKP